MRDVIAAVLAHYEGCEGATAEPLGGGLINASFLVTTPTRRLVLQRVNPIFSPGIHHNILAVTEHLAASGIATPRLVGSREGGGWVELREHGVWRLMTALDGACFATVQSPAHAESAGELVGRFHAALDGLEHTFVDMRVGVHDTAAHLAKLARAATEATGHRLHSDVSSLAAGVLEAAAGLEPLPDMPVRICHGDLKLDNILFVGPEPPARDHALCLIDLDTVGPMHLGYEMGDALRSWCNPGGEDRGPVRLDLDVWEAALRGYAAGLGRPFTDPERAALLLGVEWVSLELCARFAADALLECYFGWDATRFPGRGEHNLARARGQWGLYGAALATREQRARRR